MIRPQLVAQADTGPARWYRPAMTGLAVAGLVVAILTTVGALAAPAATSIQPFGDLDLYRGAAQRWLDTGAYYLPYQVAGPYTIAHGDVLYPPPSLLLFVPMAVLPHVVAVLVFAAVPAMAVGWAVWRHRPSPWALALIGLCLAWPVTGWRIVALNPVLWAAAAVALGTVRPFFAPFALLKMTVGAWAFGAWRREWWAGLATVAVMALLFAPMWPDWVAAMRNSNGQLGHSLGELPIVAVPLIAWAGRNKAAPAG